MQYLKNVIINRPSFQRKKNLESKVRDTHLHKCKKHIEGEEYDESH